MGDITKNLSKAEFACKCGCGFVEVNPLLPHLLQQVVDHFMDKTDHSLVKRVSIHINSGNRCKAHNEKEGGSSRSRHMKGEAADFYLKYVMHDVKPNGRNVTRMVNPTDVAKYLDKKYPNKYGVGWYNGRTHFDVSSSGRRRWDMR